MTAEQLLAQLAALDIQLSVADGKLLCNAPKGALTPAWRAAISEQKLALLSLLAQPPSLAPARAGLQPGMGMAQDLPLSLMQERIWLLGQLDPQHHITGNVPFAFRLEGYVDKVALEQALQALIQRHAVFRTVCSTVGQQVQQAMLPETDFKLTVLDVTALSAAQRETVIQSAAVRCLRQPFDFATAPLLRAELLHTGMDEHILLLATHLFVFDGWSTAVLFGELSRLYAAYRAGEPDPLPPLVAQYADFACWHRQWFAGAEAAKQRAYWLAKLRDTRLVTDLPMDRPRLHQAVVKTASVEFAIPAFLAEAVRTLSQQAGVTLFTTLLAAFQTLLYSHTRQEHLAIGTIVSNRRLAETEGMIGSFANSLLMAAHFREGITFRDLLEQVKQTAQEAYANQDMPFECLLNDLPPVLQAHPLFRVMFVLHQHQSIQQSGLALAGLRLHKLPLATPHSRYDLELVMVERNGALSGQWEYNAGLFNPATLDGMTVHWLRVLKQVSEQPDLPLANLPQPESAQLTATQRKLRVLWQQLLGREHIGLHERFMDVGGHSLLTIRLLGLIGEQFGVIVTPLNFVSFPTLAGLAAYLDTQQETMA